MPGINSLADREFVRVFQAMDGVIQNNQPLFMVAWVGSVLGLVATTAMGLFQLDGSALALLVVAAAVYLLGVQLPTAVINIPMNNRLQKVDVDTASEEELARERQAFEARWNKWNRIRTAFGVVAVALLLVVILQL